MPYSIRMLSRRNIADTAGKASDKPIGRLPLLSLEHAVTFVPAEHHCPLVSSKLFCLVREARMHE